MAGKGEAMRRVELAIADALGRVGPTLTITLAGRTFANAPILWQDWTLWQHCVVEERYGSVRRFQRMWLGLDGEADEESDPLEQAAALAEKARRINEGKAAHDKGGEEAALWSPLAALGTVESLRAEDQAFYVYALLGPWEAVRNDDGEYERLLSDADIERGPDTWTITPGWVLANVTPAMLQGLITQIIVAQLEASAGELEGEAEAGDHPKEGSSSPPSAGDD